VYFVLNVVNILSKRSLSPKVFSFHFESPSLIGEKYGQSSEQYKLAILLVDTVISLIKEVKSKGEMCFDDMIIFYESATHQTVRDTQDQLASVGGSNIGTQYFPHIYFPNEHKVKISSLCRHLKATLSNVVCREELESSKRALMQAPAPAGASPASPPSPAGPPAPGPQYNPLVGQMHVVIWAVVTMLSILGGAIFCLFSVTNYAESDSTLYGSTRMVFEKPRGRPHAKQQQ